jgi:hypothetical protein
MEPTELQKKVLPSSLISKGSVNWNIWFCKQNSYVWLF